MLDAGTINRTTNFSPGQIISYLEMCQGEHVSLQRGMNFHLRGDTSVILMSRRVGAPYSDSVEEDGRVLVYEGHDVPKERHGPHPKQIDQPWTSASGRSTQNKLLYDAARRAAQGLQRPELVRVYEKIKQGIWTFNGTFQLTNAWIAASGHRKVFKFRLEMTEQDVPVQVSTAVVTHSRMIPSDVKLRVWKRDQGQCVICGQKDNLHFDHDIPFSKGGSSLLAENIRLLCARHNLSKHDRIE